VVKIERMEAAVCFPSQEASRTAKTAEYWENERSRVGNHFYFDLRRSLNPREVKARGRMLDKSKIKFGEPLPSFLFKPGESIINCHWPEQFRRGICTQKHLDGMKMLVVEVGIDNETRVEGYRLLFQLPGVVDHSSQKIVQWRLRIYVESNFEPCDHPAN
jgi:hypothetical protein